MKIREARLSDIPQLHNIRLSVKENRLSNPALVTENDYIEYLSHSGKGWVCEIANEVTGFVIVDLEKNNVWALFVNPELEAIGIGKNLLNTMLEWYFLQTKQPIWLGTDPNSRAEKFYRMQGWKQAGLHGTNEIKFEMSYEDWNARQKACES